MRRSVASRNTETRTGTFNNRFLTNKRQRELAQSSPRERHTRDTIIGMNTQHVRESSAQACNSSETRPSPTPHPGYLTPPYGEAPPGDPHNACFFHTYSVLPCKVLSCHHTSPAVVSRWNGLYMYRVVSRICISWYQVYPLYIVISLYLVFSLCLSRVRALLGQRLLISPLIMGISQAQHHGRGSCVAHFPDP